MKKYTRFAGHFDDHADAPVGCGTHCPIEHNQGFTWSHWTLPSGNYSHRTALAAAMVIDGNDTQNTKANCCCFSGTFLRRFAYRTALYS